MPSISLEARGARPARSIELPAPVSQCQGHRGDGCHRVLRPKPFNAALPQDDAPAALRRRASRRIVKIRHNDLAVVTQSPLAEITVLCMMAGVPRHAFWTSEPA
jgi:hypothetical protein